MKLIEKLSDKIEDEIKDADEYIVCAMNHKQDHPQLAETFYKLSTEEMQHMSLLHDQVVKLIDEYRKAHGDPPADMMARYEYLHERHIRAATEVKIKQAAYKSSQSM